MSQHLFPVQDSEAFKHIPQLSVQTNSMKVHNLRSSVYLEYLAAIVFNAKQIGNKILPMKSGIFNHTVLQKLTPFLNFKTK